MAFILGMFQKKMCPTHGKLCLGMTHNMLHYLAGGTCCTTKTKAGILISETPEMYPVWFTTSICPHAQYVDKQSPSK